MVAMTSALEELATQLKREHLYVNSERDQLQKIYDEVKRVAENVYHISWVARQQRTNLESLIVAACGITPSECYAKTNQLEYVSFVNSYKQLSYHDSKFAGLLRAVRDNPKLLAQCIALDSTPEPISKIVGIIFSSIYGNCVMLEDEYLALSFLHTLAELQLSTYDNPRRLLRKGSGAFSCVFKIFFDSLFSAKLFLTAALHDPVMRLLMEDEWFYDIDPDKAVVRFPPVERQRRFGDPGTNDWKVKVQNYRRFIVDKLASLANRFISAIKNNMHCFPPSLMWLVSQVYQLLSKTDKHMASEVRAICADLVFTLFICPAICDPEPYGITSDVPISHIARHNLMQIAQIVQILAISHPDEISPKLKDLYGKFEKGTVSCILDAMIDNVGSEPPSSANSQLQCVSRSSVLITLTQLNTFVSFTRSALPQIEEKTAEIRQIEEILSSLPTVNSFGIQSSTSTSNTPSHTPPDTPSIQRKLGKGHWKKMSLTSADEFNASLNNSSDYNDGENPAAVEDVLVFSLGVSADCPGMIPEQKVLSMDQENRRRRVKYQCGPNYEENVGGAEIQEKRTRFSLSHDQESLGNTSDNQEAISEVASSHSVGSVSLDNDNFSDMISANVSGRGTPNVSGRDTPLSQAESVEERRAPDLPETVHKTNREDVTERFGKFEIKAELERDETKSTVSDTWSTDVLASDSEPPEQNQLERLEEVTEEMVRQNLLGVQEPVSEVSETASDAWSTDVLASDTEEKQAELFTDIEQDDISSVTDRSVNQDELESSDTVERSEETPLASGGESPAEEREFERLDDAVGGTIRPRIERGNLKSGKLDSSKKGHGSKGDGGVEGAESSKQKPFYDNLVQNFTLLDNNKLLNVPRQRISATIRQAQGKVSAMFSVLDPHSKARSSQAVAENMNSLSSVEVITAKAALPGMSTPDSSPDMGFNSPGEEEESRKSSNLTIESLTSKDSGIMESPQSEVKVNGYGSDIDHLAEDVKPSEQQNSRLDEQRLSAALTMFDPLVNGIQDSSGLLDGTSVDAHLDEVFSPVSFGKRHSSSEPAAVMTSNLVTDSSGKNNIVIPAPLRMPAFDQEFADTDDKTEKSKKSFFKTFKEKINKGMKKKGKSERDDVLSGELGASTDGYDNDVRARHLMEPNIVITETGEDILAKYRKKTILSQNADISDGQPREKHHSLKDDDTDCSLFYDPSNLENCFAFSDAKRKLRLVLSMGEYQSCFSHCHFQRRWLFCEDAQWKDTELVSLLRAQLAEAINLRNKDMIAQLYEVIRCVKIFDSSGCKKLVKSLQEDYKGRASYVAYLIRCKQGLLTTQSYLQTLLNRVQRDKEICNHHMISVCVQRFIEKKEKVVSYFLSDFQKLTVADEKTYLVEKFLSNLYQSMEQDPLWQASSDRQLKDGRLALERYLMGRIYTHAMFPNADGDIMRDQIIHQHISKLSHIITPSHKDLRIPKMYHYECPWPAAQREIYMINAYKTPRDKIQCVVRCSLSIMNLLSMANEKSVPAADDFIPVLIFVIIKANPPCLLSTIQYVNSFYGDRVAGEEQYWWMQFSSAVEFIKTMDYSD